MFWTILFSIQIKVVICRLTQISYKFRSQLRNLGDIILRNGSNIHVNLFSKSEPATYAMGSELQGANLKNVLNNNAKAHKMKRKSRGYLKNCKSPRNLASKICTGMVIFWTVMICFTV